MDTIYIVWNDGELETATTNPQRAYEAAIGAESETDNESTIAIWRNGKADATYTPAQFAENEFRACT